MKEPLLDRLPPQSLDSEMAALGAALISRNAAERVLELLRPEDFYSERHRKLYEVYATLAEREQPVDTLSVQEELRQCGLLDRIGGPGYLSLLADSVPTAAHLDYYAEVVREKAGLRHFIEACATLEAEGWSGEFAAGELRSRAEARFSELSAERAAAEVLGAAPWFMEIADTLIEDAAACRGIFSGFPSLDRRTNGWQPGDLIIVAGRPSMGKTTLCNGLARHAVGLGYPTGIFSLEMSRKQLGQRFLAAEAEVDFEQMVQGHLRHRQRDLYAALDRLRQLPLHVCDTAEMTLSDIRGQARKMVRERGVRLIIIDQLQTIAASGNHENENVRFTRIAYGLKAMARALSVPVILQAQLHRQVERRENKRPMLSDLRDSGSLEQAADQVLFLYRHAYYRRNEEGFVDTGDGEIELDLAKQRQGSTGRSLLWGRLSECRIWEPSPKYGDADAPPERRY